MGQPAWQTLAQRLAHDERPACLVQVESTQGSAPREPGAWMVVWADGSSLGSVGGGHLEWQAQQAAQQWLQTTGADTVLQKTMALGPSLGQCCGGQVQLRWQRMTWQELTHLAQTLRPVLTPVALFGAGHVGQALVQALNPLPFQVHWIDSREEAFAQSQQPMQGQCEQADPVHAVVPQLAPGSHVRIMSFSHAEDFEIVRACLQRQQQQGDLGSVGLIGSRTKWAQFQARLRARGMDEALIAQVQCPIGLPGIRDKAPAVIAASVAAQLLMERETHLSPPR